MNRKTSQRKTKSFLHSLARASCLLVGMLTVWSCTVVTAYAQEVGVYLDVKLMCGESGASWAKSTVRVWLDGKPWSSGSLMYATPGAHNLKIVTQEKTWVVKEVKLLDVFKPGSLEQRTTRSAPNTAGEANVAVSFATPTGGTGDNRIEIIIETCGLGSDVRITTIYECRLEPNPTRRPAPAVTIRFGDRTVTTDASGFARISMPRGNFLLNRIPREDELIDGRFPPKWFVHQSGNFPLYPGREPGLRAPGTVAPDTPIAVELTKNEEVLEVNALFCESKAIALVSEVQVSESGKSGVLVARLGRTEWEELRYPTALHYGDQLIVYTTAKIRWMDGSEVSIEGPGYGFSPAKVQIGISRPEETGDTRGVWERYWILRLLDGPLGIKSWFTPATSDRIKDPTEIDGTVSRNYCRGTIVTVRTNPQAQQDTISVDEGEVEVIPNNPALRPVILRSGQQVQVAQNNVGSITAITARGNTGTTVTGGRAPSSGVGGVWNTPTGETIELIQEDNRITGTYRGVLGTGSISATFDGRTITGSVTGGQAGLSVTQPLTLRLTDDGRLEGQIGSTLIRVDLILTRR